MPDLESRTRSPGAARAVLCHDRDDVAVVLDAVTAGEPVTLPADSTLTAATDCPPNHKVARWDIPSGAHIRRFGEIIARATEDIPAGAHVHTHNAATLLAAHPTFQYRPEDAPAPAPIDPPSPATFHGYPRPDGRVGVRNEIWVINTVACVNAAASLVARRAAKELAGSPSVDAVRSFSHPYGCSQLGDDLANTREILARLLTHPNCGGAIVMGLGCENNQSQELLRAAGLTKHDPRLRLIVAQDVEDEVEAGIDACHDIAREMARDQRQPCGIDNLVIGVKCGGSDGLSGITANPIVGRLAEAVCSAGGTILQTEVPEMFGAERALMNRARDEGVFDQIVDLIEGFKRYFTDHDQPVYENPSPGNKDGGITTLEEKSLGAVQKGGSAPVAGVLPYAQPCRSTGLWLINAPGNDGVSSTALVAAGAQIILFTTGRGTPLGFPAPTLKIASNSELADRKRRWIDFDAGRLVSESRPRDDLARELLALTLDVASNRQPASNELNEVFEIAIWKTGVTL